jgi:uncharacterized membrane protein
MLLTLLGALALVCHGAQAQYKYQTVDYPGFVGETAPLGINNHGDVAGYYFDAYGAVHGYIRVNGYFSKVNYPGSISTYCSSITEEGDLTGTYFDCLGFQHGFRRHGDTYTPIDEPDAVQTTGIPFELGPGLGTAAALHNRQGDVVGEYAGLDAAAHGWLLSHGQFQTIDIPGQANLPGMGSGAISVNDADQVVGAYYTLSLPRVHGFLWSKGASVEIAVPGATDEFGTQTNGINNRGDIVGLYSGSDGTGHGFLLHAGRFTDVDYPFMPFSECHGINDRGAITGLYYDWLGIAHGFIATPK